MAIQITRKEQQIIHKLKTVMAAEQTQAITNEMLQDVDPGQSVVGSLVDKGIIVYDQEQDQYTLTKEQLQVMDDDPEVEQAWEDFRAVRGNGSMAELYSNSDKNKVLKANKHLVEVLFRKGRLTHMVDKDHGHIWVTEDKVDYWKNRGWKEAAPEAVPIGLQA